MFGMNIAKLIDGFKLRVQKSLVMNERIGKTDLGILKVAFMIAALDGEITDAEYAAFDAYAKKCRGYTPENAEAALREAMHSAGYLLLLSKRVGMRELVKAFVEEAKAALPDGFAFCSIEDVRRAVVTWIAVGLSDGDYSDRERACIEALRRNFAEIRIRRVDEETERWAALSPSFRMAYAQTAVPGRITLIEKAFVERVEELVARYGDSAAAAKELKALLAAK